MGASYQCSVLLAFNIYIQLCSDKNKTDRYKSAMYAPSKAKSSVMVPCVLLLIGSNLLGQNLESIAFHPLQGLQNQSRDKQQLRVYI